MTSENTSSGLGQFHNASQNYSTPTGCMAVRFSEWDFLPWNNSDNFASFQTVVTMGEVRSSFQHLMALIGGPANLINMAVFYKQGLRDRVNLLLFSLSLADMLNSIMAMLHGFPDVYAQFTNNPNIGRVFLFIRNNYIFGFLGFCFVSFFLSAVVACERCYCVMKPLEYQTLIRTRTLAIIIVATYVINLGATFIIITRYTIGCFYDVDSGTVKFRFYPSGFYKKYKDFVEYTDSIVFGITLQSGILIVVITATVITVYKLRESVAFRMETSSSVSAKEVSLTKMLIGTSTLLIVCVSPSGLIRLANIFWPELNTGGRYENLYYTCLRISFIFVSINSTLNIFVYYAMGERYRATFRSLFGRKSARNSLSREPKVTG